MPLPNHLDRLVVFYQEALAKVASSHDEKCECLVCRAAGGDEDAIAKVMAGMRRE